MIFFLLTLDVNTVLKIVLKRPVQITDRTIQGAFKRGMGVIKVWGPILESRERNYQAKC